MTQQYSSDGDNEGSNVSRRPITGEYASLDEIAAQGHRPWPEAGADAAVLIREVISEQTDMQVGTAMVVTRMTRLEVGQATMFTVIAVDGVEYEVFVRQADR